MKLLKESIPQTDDGYGFDVSPKGSCVNLQVYMLVMLGDGVFGRQFRLDEVMRVWPPHRISGFIKEERRLEALLFSHDMMISTMLLCSKRALTRCNPSITDLASRIIRQISSYHL
jgi:hypothetical protein